MNFIKLVPSILLGSFLFVSCKGTPPSDLGLRNAQLIPCNKELKCFSSNHPKKEFRIRPVKYETTKEVAVEKIKNVVQSFSNATIRTQEQNYLHIEFTRQIFQFVDDVEIYFPSTEKVILIKSSPRNKFPDFGANKQRVHDLIFKFHQS